MKNLLRDFKIEFPESSQEITDWIEENTISNEKHEEVKAEIKEEVNDSLDILYSEAEDLERELNNFMDKIDEKKQNILDEIN